MSVGLSSVSSAPLPAPITRSVSLAMARDLSSWRECTLTLEGILGRSDKLKTKCFVHSCIQWLSLPWPPLEVGPVMLPLRGLGPDAVKEVRRLLLRVGGLQHHAIKALHTDGALVTMSKGLWTKIFSNLYCMTSCNSYQIDHVAVLSKLKSCNLWASILLI